MRPCLWKLELGFWIYGLESVSALVCPKLICIPFFFYQGFLSWTLTTHRTDGGMQGTIFYSTLPLPPPYKHSDIYLQLCTWDDYHTFLIATLVFTRLLLNKILPPYGITIWLIDDLILILACLFIDLILGFVTAILHEKLVDSNSHRLSSLYYKRTN